MSLHQHPSVFSIPPGLSLAMLRRRAAVTIEALIAFLDMTEPDANLEPEPAEDDDPAGGDVLDACEPAMGAPENQQDQRWWATGGALDLFADEREADLSVGGLL